MANRGSNQAAPGILHRHGTGVAAGCLCLAMLLACADSLGPQSLAGTWAHSEALSAPACTSNGTLTIVATATGFTGTVTLGACTTSFGIFRGPRDAPTTADISQGQGSGTAITFQTPSCTYQGTLSGIPPDRMNGTVSCSDADWGAYAGTWQSSR